MTRSVLVHNNKRMAKTKPVRTQNVKTCQWQTWEWWPQTTRMYKIDRGTFMQPLLH